MDRPEVLEPRVSQEQSRVRALNALLNPKPDMSIGSSPRSSVLDQVKSFLPKMAEAEVKLQSAIRDGLQDKFNVENVEDDERFVEMDVALLKEKDGTWTSDSEADSTPSQSENDFTSDSDISSSSACSSSSCSSDSGTKVKQSSKKRPLIQEMSDKPNKNSKQDSTS